MRETDSKEIISIHVDKSCEEKRERLVKPIFTFLFIYLWLPWVFIALCRLSLVAVSRGYSSLWWLRLLRSTGSRCSGLEVVAQALCCYEARGIFPDQGLNWCPLHGKVDS